MHRYTTQFKQQVTDITNNFKNELIAITAMFISFVTPISGLFCLVGMAVVIDTLFGIYASIKLKGLSSIQSHNLFNVAIKTFFYMGTILMAYMASLYITDGSAFGIDLFLPKFMCGFWMFIEGKSMDETSIKLGHRPVLEVIQSVIKWIKNLKKDINDIK